MNIIVNGDARQVDDGCTLADLLLVLEVNPRRVAVEVNENLVPRGQHGSYRLQPNDALEVVTLVGGG